MSHLDCIFIDLDGPILEGKARHYYCYKKVLEQFGGCALPIEKYWEMKRAKVSREAILEASHFFSSYESFKKAWLQQIESAESLSLDRLKPGVKETLTCWREAVAEKIVLVTMRQHRARLLRQLKALGIYGCFDEIVTCPPTGERIKFRALEHYRFNSAMMIGDTEEDVNTARLLNIPVVGIANGLRDEKFLEADYIFNEISDIDAEFFLKMLKNKF